MRSEFETQRHEGTKIQKAFAPAVAIFRNRRTLIAALAVVGSLAVWSMSLTGDDGDLFIFLERHPSAIGPFRMAFSLAGKQDEFERQLVSAHIYVFAIGDGLIAEPK